MTHVQGTTVCRIMRKVDKLASARAQMLVVHKVSRRCRLLEESLGGSKHEVVRARGVKQQVVLQVRGSSSEDDVQLVKERHKTEAARAYGATTPGTRLEILCNCTWR